jgi:hypothetical protein
MERREGERVEVRQRPSGASPFYRGPEGAGRRGFMAGVNASASRHRLPESRGGRGVIVVN